MLCLTLSQLMFADQNSFLQTVEEREELKRYGSKHTQLNIYSDPTKVDIVLKQIETCIQTIDNSKLMMS